MKPSNELSREKTAATDPQVFEDEFLNVEGLVGVKQDAAKRTLKRVIAEVAELARENRWQEILSLCHPAEKNFPELVETGLDSRLREKTAFALGQTGKFDEAIRELETCIRREPDNFHLHSSLAYTAYNSLYAAKNRDYFLAGKIRAERIAMAHRHFSAAQALRSNGVTNFYREGMLYKQIENKTEQALPLFHKAVVNWDSLDVEQREQRHQERKNFIKALYQLASALLEIGRPAAALEHLKRCMAEDEKSGHLSLVYKYFALGKVNFQLNRFAEARDALLFALQCKTAEHVDFVCELLARTYLALGNADRALEILGKIPEKFRRPYYRWTEADALASLGDLTGARRVLLSSLERDARSKHKTLIRLAKIEYLQRNFEKAMKHAAEAVAFFQEKWGNSYDHGLFWQAVSALQLGELQTARNLAAELQNHNPRYPKLDRLLAKLAEGEKHERTS